MNVLIDTSAWIDFFRNTGGAAGGLVAELIQLDQAYLVLTDFLLQFFTSAFLYQTTVLQSRLKYNVYLHFNHTGQV
ncbi:MAG: hypothetical protein D3903_14635 [Candidatus Electrothrix sp. GM3_4]|nr:hypothetical protein [Candidatus Electrothrix sp. GM3_4]